MKTLDELLNELSGSRELQEKFTAASGSAEKLQSFLKEQGCEAAFSEIRSRAAEISDDELDKVSGGGWEDFVKFFKKTGTMQIEDRHSD